MVKSGIERTLSVLLEDELSLVVVSLVLSTSAVLSSLFKESEGTEREEGGQVRGSAMVLPMVESTRPPLRESRGRRWRSNAPFPWPAKKQPEQVGQSKAQKDRRCISTYLGHC